MSGVRASVHPTTPNGGEIISQQVKETHPPIYLQRCIQLDAAGVIHLDAGHGLSRPAVLHPFGCAARESGDDAGAVLAPHAEPVQRFGRTDPGQSQHRETHGHRGHVAESQCDQVVMINRGASGATARHARADELGHVGPHGVHVVKAAERLPADMLTGRVVLKGTLDLAAGDGAVSTPLAVRLTMRIELLERVRPAADSAVFGSGFAATAGHPLTPGWCTESGQGGMA